MGREVRMVPPGWQHPKDDKGRWIPLHSRDWLAEQAEWDEEFAQWKLGFVRSYASDGPKYEPRGADVTKVRYCDYAGRRPHEEDYMPEWPASERTHLMMYETCTEGTPISPSFATPEELARWLADNGASAFGYETATYEQWLATCRRGWAVSAVITSAGIVSGVEHGDGRSA